MSYWHYFLSWIDWHVLTQIQFYLSYFSMCEDFHQGLRINIFLSTSITIFKQLFIKSKYVMGVKYNGKGKLGPLLP